VRPLSCAEGVSYRQNCHPERSEGDIASLDVQLTADAHRQPCATTMSTSSPASLASCTSE
jgi:hypothetical protein